MRKSADAKTILVLDGGRWIRSDERVVFTGHSWRELPKDAVGIVNYQRQVRVARRNAKGDLFIDLAEPPLRTEGSPLTRRIIYN
jgi:hypothetical protein